MSKSGLVIGLEKYKKKKVCGFFVCNFHVFFISLAMQSKRTIKLIAFKSISILNVFSEILPLTNWNYSKKDKLLQEIYLISCPNQSLDEGDDISRFYIPMTQGQMENIKRASVIYKKSKGHSESEDFLLFISNCY